MNKIYILGIGGSTFARADLAKACGYNIAGLYHYNDNRTGEIDHGYRILGSFTDMFNIGVKGKCFLLSMGDMNIRKDLFNKITTEGGIVPTLIHPNAEISEYAQVSENGVIIDSQTIIQADCVIKEGAFICSQAMVCHQTIIEPYVFIAPKALIGARLHLQEFSFIGQNATLISSKVQTIGKWSTVGAGAVVTKPVPDNCIVVGNPAKAISK